MTLFQQPFNLTAASAATVTAPPAAQSAGFNRLVWEDDFTDSSSIAVAQNETLANNRKWYFRGSGLNYTFFTGTTAAGISNGNNGGGSNASSKGGIMRLDTTSKTDGGSISTLPDDGNYPSLGGNIWKHAYFEAYMQYTGGARPGGAGGGWPGFWSWSAEAHVNGQSAIETAEVDFMEYNPNSVPGQQVAPGGHNWNPHSGDFNQAALYSNNVPNPMDSNWHTYGCLWVSTGANTGNVTFYFDNVKMTWPSNNFSGGFASGTGAGSGGINILESRNLYLSLGSASSGWPVYTDWVRVWQA